MAIRASGRSLSSEPPPRHGVRTGGGVWRWLVSGDNSPLTVYFLQDARHKRSVFVPRRLRSQAGDDAGLRVAGIEFFDAAREVQILAPGAGAGRTWLGVAVSFVDEFHRSFLAGLARRRGLGLRPGNEVGLSPEQLSIRWRHRHPALRRPTDSLLSQACVSSLQTEGREGNEFCQEAPAFFSSIPPLTRLAS